MTGVIDKRLLAGDIRQIQLCEASRGVLQSDLGAIAAIPKPTVAAITGYALGGGCELALACDFRVVAEDAKLGQPEILLGVIPGAGGTQRLPRAIGVAPAVELMTSGRQIGAAEALQLGVIDRLADEAGPRAAGIAAARALLAKGTAPRRLSAELAPAVDPAQIARQMMPRGPVPDIGSQPQHDADRDRADQAEDRARAVAHGAHRLDVEGLVLATVLHQACALDGQLHAARGRLELLAAPPSPGTAPVPLAYRQPQAAVGASRGRGSHLGGG